MLIISLRKIDFTIFVLFLLFTTIGLLLKNFLVINDNIIQFIKDSWGNIGGVIVASFFFFWWAKESKFIKRELIVFLVSIGLSIYEFVQILIPWQTFDVNDIVGTLFGGIIASIINVIIIKSLGIFQNKKLG